MKIINFREDELDATIEAQNRRLKQIRKRYKRPMSKGTQKRTAKEYDTLLAAMTKTVQSKGPMVTGTKKSSNKPKNRPRKLQSENSITKPDSASRRPKKRNSRRRAYTSTLEGMPERKRQSNQA